MALSHFQEETLLFSSTRRAQAPLEMLVDDMPVLQAGGGLSTRYGWEGLLQLLRKEPGWCCLGRLHADYSNCRAYFLQNAGFKVLVEPVVDRRNGTWSLAVGSCVQLSNSCSMTLRVYVGRVKRNWGGRAISCFAARVTGDNREKMEPEEYIDILPGCRRSVPLSWFGNGAMPSLTARLHTEDGFSGLEDSDDKSSPDIPPVAFPALYKLTNKTGCMFSHEHLQLLPPLDILLSSGLLVSPLLRNLSEKALVSAISPHMSLPPLVLLMTNVLSLRVLIFAHRRPSPPAGHSALHAATTWVLDALRSGGHDGRTDI